MGQGTPMELVKIKKIVAEIQEFPTKIDSAEQAKNARHLLRKYALLSEKIERNVLIGAAHQKDLAKIRTDEFKTIRRTLKEKANSILHAHDSKKAQSEKPAKKTAAKTAAPKKTAKAADSVAKEAKATKASASKETGAKKTVKKASPKPKKEAAPKESK